MNEDGILGLLGTYSVDWRLVTNGLVQRIGLILRVQAVPEK